MAEIWTLLPFLVLLIALPLGVAGQNIAAALAAGIFLYRLSIGRQQSQFRISILRAFAPHLALASGFIVWIVLAGMLNPHHPHAEGLAYLAGYLPMILLPVLISAAGVELSQRQWQRLESVLASVVLMMAMIALSQSIWGWRFDDGAMVSAPRRAQGFYSHPLTFAYVALLIFPFGISRVVTLPGQWTSWAIFLSTLIAIYTSQSRTVQILAGALIFYNIAVRAQGRLRLVFASFAVVALLVLSVTDNPLRRKIGATLAGGHDVRSGYVDDRLAFWHAHWEMFKERPVLGHGDNLNAEYRAPYYQRIGLGSFERQYEAHNMYIQVLINGGLIGLGLFVAWYCVWLRTAFRASMVGFETLIVLGLAGLTQNAFQDFEVRYGLTLVLSALGVAGTWATTRLSKTSNSCKFGAIS